MKPLRSPLTLLLALTTALVLVASGCSAGDGKDSDAAQTRVVATDKGDVTIPAQPKRVVVLNYALAGYLYGLDVPVTALIPEDTEVKGEFSPRWAEKAKADGTTFLPWSADGFNTEAILKADPDLIIAGGIGFPLMHANKAYDALTAIAPTVIVSGTFNTWQQQYSFLAEKVFDKPQVYHDAVAAYDKRIDEVKSSIEVPAGEVSFVTVTADLKPFVLIENQGLPVEFAKLGFRPAPLFATGKFTPYTTGGDMFGVSPELVPSTLTQDTLFIMGFNGDTADVAKMRAQPIWANLPAFRNNHAYDLPYWALRSDYDEALDVLSLVQKTFAKS